MHALSSVHVIVLSLHFQQVIRMHGLIDSILKELRDRDLVYRKIFGKGKKIVFEGEEKIIIERKKKFKGMFKIKGHGWGWGYSWGL